MWTKTRAAIIVGLALSVGPASALAIELTAVTFPERRNVRFGFERTQRAPLAEVRAKVEYQEGNATIDIDFEDMKPAVLFGGDVTSYVVWAVARDGSATNLGELWMDGDDGEVELATGAKTFALVITAEAYPLVRRPSELVVFFNRPCEDKRAANDAFEFTDLAPPPTAEASSIANLALDASLHFDVIQAEKAYELARKSEAEDFAPLMMRDAHIALGQARALATTSKRKTRIDYSRRAVALASDAIEVTLRKKEAQELERQIAARKAEMEALGAKVSDAETRAEAARKALLEAQQAITRANEERSLAEATIERVQAQVEALNGEKAGLEAEKIGLEAEKLALVQEQAVALASLETMRQETETLRQEREELASRLQGALSAVAETRDSARGFIVNLPDILFDVNKASLKHEAQLVIAKLVGILLVMPDLNLRVEGHTDSQGSDEYNQELSEDRARAVTAFLAGAGIDHDRMTAVGYGEMRPVADNETAAGRSKNRRVEVVIARGDVAEGAAEDVP